MPEQLRRALEVQAELTIDNGGFQLTMDNGELTIEGQGQSQGQGRGQSQEQEQPLVLASQQGGADIGVGVCPAITAAAGTSGNNQPVLFENHPQDARFTGPLEVSPTILAAFGTGGNRVPLVKQEQDESYCIAGNVIGREEKNGGNGFGYQEGVCYTLNTIDRHAVYNRRGYSDFSENQVAGTQCARQYKDATDLVCENGNHQAEPRNLIRRLTPLECERLQGFADGWTDIPTASDSKRYKALGNSVAIPCMNYIMRGIGLAAAKEKSCG